MTGVLAAVGPRWDSRLATELESVPELDLARRCADLADLLAAAAAGLGSLAIVSEDLRGLDLSVVATLRGAGIVVVGASVPGDEGSERRLRQIGIDVVIPADADRGVLADRLGSWDALVSQVRAHSGALDATALLDDGPDGRGRPPDGLAAPSATDGTSEPLVEPESPGRVVTIWGPTGAPGRTTVAVNLAAELASLGVPTLLVDADTFGGCVAQVLSMLDEAPGIAAAARAAEQGTLDLPVLARLAPEVMPGLRVLTGLPRSDRWPEVREAAFERVLEVARLLAQVVVVDTGFGLEDDEELSYDTRAPRRNATTLCALAQADTVLAVGGCDPVGLQRLVRGLQELGTLSCPQPRVVVNRVRAGAVGSRPETRVTQALGRFAGVTQLSFVPDDQPACDRALLEGRALLECAPTSPARLALRELATLAAGVPAPVATRRLRG